MARDLRASSLVFSRSSRSTFFMDDSATTAATGNRLFNSLNRSPEGEDQGFRDSVLLEDTVALDTCSSETQLERLDFDTEVFEDYPEVVYDSEDERCSAGFKGASLNNEGTNQVFVDCDQGFSRLNYVSSEEPGESSQACALEFVDTFLSSSNVELSPETEPRKGVRTSSSRGSSARGARCLARRITTRTPDGNVDAFEWSSCDHHERVGMVRHKKTEAVESQGDRRSEEFDQKSAIFKGSPDSGSKAIVDDSNEVLWIGQVSGASSENNYTKDSDDQLHAIPLRQEADNASGDKSTADMFDSFFDTQMAAEVMETLSYSITDPCTFGITHQSPRNALLGSFETVTKTEVPFRGSSCRKVTIQSLENVARVSKQKRSSGRKRTSSLPWRHSVHKGSGHEMSVATKAKCRNSVTDGAESNPTYSTHAIATSDGKSHESVEKSKEMDAAVKNCINKCENVGSLLSPDGADHSEGLITPGELKPNKDSSEFLRKRADNVIINNIITYRRKRSRSQKRKCVLESSLITYKRRRNLLDAKPSEGSYAIGKCDQVCSNAVGISRDRGTSQQRQANLHLSVQTSFLSSDVWNCPKRKRTKHKWSSQPKGASKQHGEIQAVDFTEHDRKVLNRNLPESSPLKELARLSFRESNLDFTGKHLRKRRDMANVHVLFSQHLDDDIIKQQKKILTRLGISMGSSLRDATHFVADRFVRTMNMLEAIALSKPVVTHLWLESCVQASCLIDERDYILRDAKKEREIGFILPVSLARSSQHPLLKGKRVFITPSIKPNKVMIASLVEAVHGQVVEKNQIPNLKIPADLLILSCEEDLEICVPFLNKGAAVYSSELVLNGIIIQKLEYERR